MAFTNRISQALHDEHDSTVALMVRLKQMLAQFCRDDLPSTQDRAVNRVLSELSVAISGEIERHFVFEEEELFPYLGAAGDAAIGAHLAEEHNAMRPIGSRIAALALDAADRGFDVERWREFRRLGNELCDLLLAHVQKEEMALLPLLEEAMDADTESRLYQDYVEQQ